MGRVVRTDIGGYVYHVLNRGNARGAIFHSEKDYVAFEEILSAAVDKYQMRLVAYCLMPNHFHLVLYPERDGQIRMFMQWLTLTHTQRYHAQTKTAGYGHLYQGRYKSFIVENDSHVWTLLTYVEKNPIRAKLVSSPIDWKWSSYYKRHFGTTEQKKQLATDSVTWHENYAQLFERTEDAGELISIRNSINRGTPYGGTSWLETILQKFPLGTTVNKRGRPKKGT